MTRNAMFGGSPVMHDAPEQQPWYRQPGYRPTNFLMDAAAKFIGEPLYNIASGALQSAVSAPRDQVPLSDDPREAQAVHASNQHNATRALGYGVEAGGLAALGSIGVGGSRASGGLTKPEVAYHYGKAPLGGKFDVSKSSYDGDVFVSPSSQGAMRSANYGGPNLHKLSLKPGAKIFDFENPSHVDGAIKWWDDVHASGGENHRGPTFRKDITENLRRGEYSAIEPDTGDISGYTVNPYIRENFDGYYMRENPGDSYKTLGIHKPNSLFNQDGSVFYSNPFAGAVAPTYEEPQNAMFRR